jgi:hypothetical protein
MAKRRKVGRASLQVDHRIVASGLAIIHSSLFLLKSVTISVSRGSSLMRFSISLGKTKLDSSPTSLDIRVLTFPFFQGRELYQHENRGNG